MFTICTIFLPYKFDVEVNLCNLNFKTNWSGHKVKIKKIKHMSGTIGRIKNEMLSIKMDIRYKFSNR